MTGFTFLANLQNWMDEELGKALQEELGNALYEQLEKALQKDDKRQFISLIDEKLDLFRPRQQQLLYAVCNFGSVMCANALVKGDTRLTVELNNPCTDSGMYPLHCAALALFPSIVELFLCSGAQTDIRVKTCNLSHVSRDSLLEDHANRLPLHMALWRIS